jgi:hypothetical protein
MIMARPNTGPRALPTTDHGKAHHRRMKRLAKIRARTDALHLTPAGLPSADVTTEDEIP